MLVSPDDASNLAQLDVWPSEAENGHTSTYQSTAGRLSEQKTDMSEYGDRDQHPVSLNGAYTPYLDMAACSSTRSLSEWVMAAQ